MQPYWPSTKTYLFLFFSSQMFNQLTATQIFPRQSLPLGQTIRIAEEPTDSRLTAKMFSCDGRAEAWNDAAADMMVNQKKFCLCVSLSLDFIQTTLWATDRSNCSACSSSAGPRTGSSTWTVIIKHLSTSTITDVKLQHPFVFKCEILISRLKELKIGGHDVSWFPGS